MATPIMATPPIDSETFLEILKDKERVMNQLTPEIVEKQQQRAKEILNRVSNEKGIFL